jgi:hypothetical protein
MRREEARVSKSTWVVVAKSTFYLWVGMGWVFPCLWKKSIVPVDVITAQNQNLAVNKKPQMV